MLLEPMLKDGECHGLLYSLLTSIKQSVDALEPDNQESNKVPILAKTSSTWTIPMAPSFKCNHSEICFLFREFMLFVI